MTVYFSIQKINFVLMRDIIDLINFALGSYIFTRAHPIQPYL